jgi:rubrerythrin
MSCAQNIARQDSGQDNTERKQLTGGPMLIGQSIKTLESVLDLAVWLEKNGQQFYATARDLTDDVKMEQLFTYLMEEEQRHCDIYTQLFEQHIQTTTANMPLLGEYAHFIDLLIRELTSNLIIEETTTAEQLLWKALRFEKDTLLYFNEICDMFDNDSAVIIDSICREERKHIRKLMLQGEEMQLFIMS